MGVGNGARNRTWSAQHGTAAIVTGPSPHSITRVTAARTWVGGI